MKKQRQIPDADGLFRGHALPLWPLELPEPGCVHLWYLDLRELGSPLQAGQAVDPAGKFLPRQERTIRRFYLRLLLGAYLGLPGKDVAVSRQIKGKPVLDPARHDPVLDFSIAGSDGCCLVGVSADGPVGVDLELKNRKPGQPLALARRYFSAAEAAALSELTEDQRDIAFMHTWTCKEAVVKAVGHGIANRLHRFSVSVNPREPPVMLAMVDDDAGCWKLELVRPNNRQIGAVAVRQEHLRIKGFHLGPARFVSRTLP